MRKLYCFLILFLILTISNGYGSDNKTEPILGGPISNIRVPAEWEKHEAIWIQWANEYSGKVLKTFANMIKVIQQYETVNLIVYPEKEVRYTQDFLAKKGVDINKVIFHVFPIDNSWIRDNGPIYVTDGIKTWIQNWKFNGWNGGFGNCPSPNDNKIPEKVATYLNIEVEQHLDYVLEKGNVEVNGAGILAINWDCQNHRNPGMTREEHENVLKKYLGVHKIIWAFGHHEGDGTIGHIDGTGRFINEDTVVINDYGTAIEVNFAQACINEGLKVIVYSGDVSWLVGNGFVLAMGNGEDDEEEKRELESFYPGRDVHIVYGKALMRQGGGFHCVTNDQPKL